MIVAVPVAPADVTDRDAAREVLVRKVQKRAVGVFAAEPPPRQASVRGRSVGCRRVVRTDSGGLCAMPRRGASLPSTAAVHSS